jgi:hypothetical protein
MAKKKFIVFVLVGMVLIGSIISGCATTPFENSVKLEFGGTLPPEVLSYFTADELNDIEAKYILVHGRIQVSTGSLFELFSGPSVVATAVQITVGKDYRITQMNRYIKPYTDTTTKQRIPGEHLRLDAVNIILDILSIQG